LLELEKPLFLAVDRDVAEYLRISHMKVGYPADRLRSFQPRLAIGMSIYREIRGLLKTYDFALLDPDRPLLPGLLLVEHPVE
jgi:hypothetical protein